MKRATKLSLAAVAGWMLAITALHLGLNFDWAAYRNEQLPEAERKLNVAYIPVT
ncbi:hypothetical protein [Hyalangium rubrum]|uniref:Uncharacterized protein n=1 Tax=Hyalangium rubrum TaxID=3103134 RepID=A0ABU5GXD0_9BACT|nr:hypothetical protein [Hyalangium sp. s54d21]MDY7225840.1 hypothetical protein [Hyalangium sp. s54d21]